MFKSIVKPKLYYHEASPPVRFVLMTIEALKINVNLQRINLFANEQNGPDYKKINHLNTVPTLVDEDLIITDSHSISTYLIDRYAEDSQLYPRNINIRAKINSILYFNCGMFFPRESIILQSAFNPERPPYEYMEKRYVETLKYFEKFFSNSDWLVGDKFTLADLCCIATYSTAELLVVIEKGMFPKTEEWADRCKNLDVYKKMNIPGLMELKRNILNYGNLDFISKNKDTIMNSLKMNN